MANERVILEIEDGCGGLPEGAVEKLFDVKVLNVAIIKVPAKPKRRGQFRGIRPGWKKAVVQLKQGDSIEIFEGAQL